MNHLWSPLLKRILWILLLLALVPALVLLPEGLTRQGRISYWIDARREEVGAPISYTLVSARSETYRPGTFDRRQFWRQYTGFWRRVLSGKMQAQITQGNQRTMIQVVPTVIERGGRSLRLLGAAVLCGALLGALLGLLSSRIRLLRPVAGVSTLAAMTVPDYLLVQFGWLLTIWTFSRFGVQLYPVLPDPSHERAWVLPFLVLAVAPMGYLARMVRLAMEESLRADYVRTARAQGHHAWRILLTHALKPVLPRILGSLPAILNISLSALVIVEIITGYDGLGTLLAHYYHLDIVAVGAMYLSVWYVLLDGGLHLLRRWADPRLQEEVAV